MKLETERTVLDALLFDVINGEFEVEAEDYFFHLQKYDILSDREVEARLLQIGKLSAQLADRVVQA